MWLLCGRLGVFFACASLFPSEQGCGTVRFCCVRLPADAFSGGVCRRRFCPVVSFLFPFPFPSSLPSFGPPPCLFPPLVSFPFSHTQSQKIHSKSALGRFHRRGRPQSTGGWINVARALARAPRQKQAEKKLCRATEPETEPQKPENQRTVSQSVCPAVLTGAILIGATFCFVFWHLAMVNAGRCVRLLIKTADTGQRRTE